MVNVLILGAAGSLARVATRYILDNNDARLTLYLRQSDRLINQDVSRVKIIEGDVLNIRQLTAAMARQDIFYANLNGDMEKQAQIVVQVMKHVGVKRINFISSMGIYEEVPEQHFGAVLKPYRESAAMIETSGLEYTIIRPGWFTHSSEVDYELTHKGEAFRGDNVSRLSIAELINRIVTSPSIYSGESLGIARV